MILADRQNTMPAHFRSCTAFGHDLLRHNTIPIRLCLISCALTDGMGLIFEKLSFPATRKITVQIVAIASRLALGRLEESIQNFQEPVGDARLRPWMMCPRKSDSLKRSRVVLAVWQDECHPSPLQAAIRKPRATTPLETLTLMLQENGF